MERDNLKYWLGINMNQAITPNRFHLLLGYFPSVEAVWKASEKKLKSISGFKDAAEKFCQSRDEGAVNKELKKCRDMGLAEDDRKTASGSLHKREL